MNFEEVREYRHGDEIRNMDWRVTARTGKAHLKVYREERERAVMLAIDIGPHMQFGTRGTFKSVQAAKIAALLGWSACGHQDRVGAVLFGDRDKGILHFRPSRSRYALWRMLRGVTDEIQAESPKKDPLPEALEKLRVSTPTGGLIFIIADFNNPNAHLEQACGHLRERHEVVLIPIDDPADQELPAMGRVLFGTADGSRLEIDTDSEEGRQLYQTHWQKNRQTIETMAWRLGMDLIPVRTDEDVHNCLVQGLRKRASRLGRRR